MNPTIYNQSDLIDLGIKLKEIGTRVLLISSNNREERESIELIKKIFIENSLTFIEYNQSETLDKNLLKETVERSKNFNIQFIISIGQINQRISGRYISQELHLPYFEMVTSFDNPLLLNPVIPIPSRAYDSYELEDIEVTRIDGIVTLEHIVEKSSNPDKILCLISLIFEISQIICCNSADPYLESEGTYLIERILDIIKNNHINTKELFYIGLSCARFTSLTGSDPLELSIIALLISNRFKLNRRILQAKILPWILDESFPVLANRIREELSDYGTSGRVSELNLTPNQLFSIIDISEKSTYILNNAF